MIKVILQKYIVLGFCHEDFMNDPFLSGLSIKGFVAFCARILPANLAR